MNDEKLLNAGQVAEKLGISRSKAYRMLRLSEIPAIKMGKNVRVSSEDLNQYIENHKTYKGGQNG
jgi:excisionase family DNA binding protein